MPKRIQYEGKTHVFPDDFSDADISAALERDSRSRMTLDQRQGTTAKGYKAPAPTLAQNAAQMRQSMTPDSPMLRMVTAPFREAVVRPMEGAAQIKQGVVRASTGKPEEIAGGVSDMARGAMQVAAPMLPVAIPAMAANIPATVGGFVGGTAGAKVGRGVTEAMGLPEGYQELAETGGGLLLGGAAGAVTTPKVVDIGRAAYDKAKVLKNLVKGDPEMARAVVGIASPRLGYGVEAAMRAKDIAARVNQIVESTKNQGGISGNIPAPSAQSEFLPSVPGPQSKFVAESGTAQVPTVKIGAKGVELTKGDVANTKWDASQLPPDPIKQTDWFRQGYEAMRARRAGATPKPETLVDDVIRQEDGTPLMRKGTEPPGEAFQSKSFTLPNVKDSEITVVTRPDGTRGVATFYVPEGSRGKGLGQQLYKKALDEGPIQMKTEGITDAARRVQDALIRKGEAYVIKDEFGNSYLSKSTQKAPGEVTTIPFAKDTPSPEFFKTKARAERAPKVEALSDLLTQHGIGPDEVASIQPVQWRDMSKALGIELPKSLEATVREVQKRMMQKASAQATTFEPSAQMLEKYKNNPKALEAAKALAEAMKQ